MYSTVNSSTEASNGVVYALRQHSSRFPLPGEILEHTASCLGGLSGYGV